MGRECLTGNMLTPGHVRRGNLSARDYETARMFERRDKERRGEEIQERGESLEILLDPEEERMEGMAIGTMEVEY